MLKIGEFSKRSHLTVKALRFYDSEGLLIPENVDKWTGYRMLYKRLNTGVFRWLKDGKEALPISEDQYRMLTQGLEVVARRPITIMEEPPSTMWFCA